MMWKSSFRICTYVIVLALALMGSMFRPVVVSGASMQPALHDGQVALMDRRSTGVTSLKRGDVVVFHHGRELFIKRVYALPGDAIRVLNFANGATGFLGDDAFPANRILRFAKLKPYMVHISRIVVPRDRVFVVGDNRTCSVDSRQFGPVAVDSIVGKVVSTREAIAALPHRLLPTAFASIEP
ncbi:MAG TPA: signal peptidase I [Armatimonadota bacterium]